jgi:hypothetical protein
MTFVTQRQLLGRSKYRKAQNSPLGISGEIFILGSEVRLTITPLARVCLIFNPTFTPSLTTSIYLDPLSTTNANVTVDSPSVKAQVSSPVLVKLVEAGKDRIHSKDVVAPLVKQDPIATSVKPRRWTSSCVACPSRQLPSRSRSSSLSRWLRLG